MYRLITLLSLLFLTSLGAAFASPPVLGDSRHALSDGYYVPVKSNNRSVCPLELRTFRTDDRLTALRVVYVGDCYEQGPFEYYCYEEARELLCWSPFQIEFLIRDSEHFLWRNKPYAIWAEFERSS